MFATCTFLRNSSSWFETGGSNKGFCASSQTMSTSNLQLTCAIQSKNIWESPNSLTKKGIRHIYIYNSYIYIYTLSNIIYRCNARCNTSTFQLIIVLVDRSVWMSGNSCPKKMETKWPQQFPTANFPSLSTFIKKNKPTIYTPEDEHGTCPHGGLVQIMFLSWVMAVGEPAVHLPRVFAIVLPIRCSTYANKEGASIGKSSCKDRSCSPTKSEPFTFLPAESDFRISWDWGDREILEGFHGLR